jgi:hypothetical protein
VDRIQSVAVTNRRFEVPPDFDFEKFTESAFNIIWGEAQEVRIRFSPWQATYIQERTWHPSQKIETQPDGSVILIANRQLLAPQRDHRINFRSTARRDGLNRPVGASESCESVDRHQSKEPMTTLLLQQRRYSDSMRAQVQN